MMLHLVYQLHPDLTLSSRGEGEGQQSQSVSASYGALRRRVCSPNPTAQALHQHVMYKPGNKKRHKVKRSSRGRQPRKKDCDWLLLYYTKVKAINHLDTTQDPEGYHRIVCKLSAPWVKH